MIMAFFSFQLRHTFPFYARVRWLCTFANRNYRESTSKSMLDTLLNNQLSASHNTRSEIMHILFLLLLWLNVYVVRYIRR